MKDDWRNVLLATACFFMASHQFLCLCAGGWHAKCHFTTRKIMVDVVIPCGNLMLRKKNTVPHTHTLSNNNHFDYRHNWKQWPLFKKQQQWIFASATFIAGLFFEINPHTVRERMGRLVQLNENYHRINVNCSHSAPSLFVCVCVCVP